jgi:hypothetical protein
MSVNKPNLETLANIAKGPTNPVPRAEDTIAEQSIVESQEWLESNKDLEPEVKLTEFLNYTSDKPRNSVYNEWHWDTYKSIHPQGPEQAVTDAVSKINQSITRLSSHQERDNWWTDNISKLSGEMLKLLAPVYLESKNRGDRQDVERARTAEYASVHSMLKNTSYENINSQKSANMHSNDWLKGYAWGYGDEMKLNAEGHLSVMVEGQETPIHSLPEPNISTEEKFIYLHDLKPQTDKKFTAELAKQRGKENSAEREMLMVAYNRIDQESIPSWAKANIIIDYNIAADPNNLDLTTKAINRIISKDIQNNDLSSIEISNKYIAYIKEIQSKSERRLM